MLGRIKTVIFLLFRINLLKTIYTNLKLLPFSQAIRLPIFIYHNVKVHGLSGKVIFNTPLKAGILKIGCNLEMMQVGSGKGEFTVSGTLVINGENVTTGNSVKIIISHNAYLEMSSNSYLGAGVKIIATSRIIIGKYFRMAYESQMIDTNFHYVMDIKTRKIDRLYSNTLIIGDYVWIGNRSSVMKGAILPSKCMVTSNSLVNRDFSNLEEHSIIGGIPAKFIKNGKSRVYNMESENYIRDFFKNHPEVNEIILPESISIF